MKTKRKIKSAAAEAAKRELPEVATVEEIAAWLRCSPETVRRMVNRGDFPCSRFGHTIRFFRPSVMAWLHGEWKTAAERNEDTRAAVAENLAQLDALDGKGGKK